MPAPSSITTPSVGDPTRQELIELIIEWVAYFNSFATSRNDVIINGSFELDSDSDGIPDGWTRTNFHASSTFLLDTSTSAADGKSVHGKRAAKYTSTGSGGGTVETTDFLEVSEKELYTVHWKAKNSVADIRNKVEITWYDCTQSSISTSSLYDEATNNPTSWTTLSAEATPPANAKYAKLKFTLADSSDATAGSAWIDEVRLWSMARRRTAETFTADATWTCPIGVTRVFIEAWGEGGVGNDSGGGGGEYRAGNFTVIPGRGYALVVGDGGAGAGDNTTVTDSVTSTLMLQANGGTNATGAASPGAGGTGGSGGDININGGAGGGNGEGGAAARGGPGGASASGAGAAGNGAAPGGGGGGNNGGGGSNGNGGIGRIIIHYGVLI